MSGFQGSISYSHIGAPQGFINIAGARNGLSVDAGGFIVLGQNVGAAGAPATLLSNREIPMANFFINLRAQATGALAVSDLAGYTSFGQGEMLTVVQTAAVNKTAVLIKINPGVSNISVPFRISKDDPGTFGDLFSVSAAPSAGAQFSYIQWGGQDGGNAYFASQNMNLTGAPTMGLGYGGVSLSGQFNITGGSGQVSSFLDFQNVTDSGSAIEYTSFRAVPQLSRTGATGITRGFYFSPTPAAGGTGKIIAFENVRGDVYLNSLAGGTPGRTGIHNVTNPTAFLHLGAGQNTPSNAPLKFTAGVNQITAEAGTFEYDGTNFFATRLAATRETIFTGVSGAAAPATTAGVAIVNFYGTSATNFLGTPNNWASVVIAGTTFKIPLYT